MFPADSDQACVIGVASVFEDVSMSSACAQVHPREAEGRGPMRLLLLSVTEF